MCWRRLSSMHKRYYLTTPIYYVNAAPHIGHTYTTIAADVIRRLRKAAGDDVLLTTGTDEHGQKIARAAMAQSKEPKEFTDVISNEFRRAWESLGIDCRFQRTTDAAHGENVGRLYTACKSNGWIYSGTYSGCYCFSDELYVTDAKPGDPCPDCGRPLEFITEENQYFQLSAFTEKLIEFHEANPEWCQPEIRRNEVMAFLRQEGGLKDLSISRSTVKWGILVPDSPGQVFYVWFDALMAYHTAALDGGWWPADLHLIGKEILRFHAIYWPAFLMAAGWPLPKRVFAHGWLLFDNDKMSKSKGNIVRATPIQQVLGADALRYFLLREIPFGSDGNFSFDALVTRYNADLANGLGNLAARTLKLARQHGVEAAAFDHPAAAQAREAFESFQFHRALASTWEIITHLDQYLVEKQPWKQTEEEAKVTLAYALGGLKLICDLAEPAIPESVTKIRAQVAGADLAPVFPRADAKEVIPKMLEHEEQELARQKALLAPQSAAEPAVAAPEANPHISIDDFAKVELRVGQVLSAERIPKADKLLHMKVDIGEAQPRTILAGIAQYYAPEQMVGRKVVVVANLAPRKMRGFESQGMIVAASLDDGAPVLAGFLEDVPVGARLK
jgi:methionyl-tRNA synthetase